MRAPLLAFAVLCAARVAAPAHASFRACAPPRHGLSVDTPQLRVWRVGERLLGCASGHRRRVLIDQSGATPPLTVITGLLPSHPMNPERLASRGTVVAYGATDGAQTGIWSLDLARPVPQVQTPDTITDDITGAAFEFAVVVGGLAIGRHGEVAAIICPRPRPPTRAGYSARAFGPEASTQ